ncbi:MAG: monofunctional biosynthetic peptidoglycan transglycosylase [Deltaproteobacteria bacterium]|jgi:monofunctional biosynthetic peptidoglycan transglycosylase|nr:monofunctional biosynthetic peptidoglycan transglycosylase [Deltaproteobacteria bacterium]
MTAYRNLLAKLRAFADSQPRISGLLAFVRRRPIISVLLVLVLLYGLNVARFLIFPQVADLTAENPTMTAFMEYRQEQWAEAGKDVKVKWTWVNYNKISENLKRAVIVGEDTDFWRHQGFDFKGIREAFTTNLSQKRLSAGGSTITQQLAKNLYLSPDKSITRKLQEAIIAWRLERNLEKERILEIYLNVVEWGEGIYGAEAAARHYFGVSAAKLSKRQASTLAAMLPGPLVRTPKTKHVQLVAAVIMRRMSMWW